MHVELHHMWVIYISNILMLHAALLDMCYLSSRISADFIKAKF